VQLVKLARKNPDVTVLCICYDENKELCKAMDVKVGPLTLPPFYCCLPDRALHGHGQTVHCMCLGRPCTACAWADRALHVHGQTKGACTACMR
jgi:hypothetical protein